jgi:hypothetical protein
MRIKLLFILFVLSGICYSQNTDDDLQVKNLPKKDYFEINPLAPAKAAFYSAVLPGLGQAYNKKYWKIPIIYGAMGLSLYNYKVSNDNYDRFLTAFKLDLENKPHEFENLDSAALERGIERFKKNRDLYVFITIGLYALNILEANVDAHLPDKKIDANLSFNPSIFTSPVNGQMNYGVALTFDF